MENYTNVDKNMTVSAVPGDFEIAWHSVKKPPFSIHGLYRPWEEGHFRRLPDSVAQATSPGVEKLARECAGGRVRFSTDSPYIAVRARYRAVGRSPHLTLVSTSGFDLYIDGEFESRFIREFRMPYEMQEGYSQVVELEGTGFRAFTISMPVHACVEEMEIGLKPGAKLGPEKPYRPLAPIVIYGSSIVHGTAACRPGNIYPLILSRRLNMDITNLGFSGQAKGERVLAEWMATLPMSVFVCDYDHNAPTVEHLSQTHYPLYEQIRKRNPLLPFIMISRPNFWTQTRIQSDILKRRDVVMESYLKARRSGDDNVYFIDGMSFFSGEHRYEYTLDGVHPNDAGFLRMADVIGSLISHILESRSERAEAKPGSPACTKA